MMSTTTRDAYDAWHAVLEVDREALAPWHLLVRAHLDAEGDLAGKAVLEVGCGRGGFTCWLAAQPTAPRRIVAVDVSSVAVKKGRAFSTDQGLRGIEWEVGDVHHLAHGSGSFDTVVSCETIEHLHDPGRAVYELGRVLRIGGRLFLTTPNYLGIMGLYRLYLRLRGRRYTEGGQPINRLTMWPRTLAWLRRAGLDIQVTDGVGHYLPVPGRPPIRLRVLDRRRTLTRWIALHSLIVAEKR
jgi:2-polyprenyl-3-methyl-5-hydroxy-6-metoxy-1,4-benzoquinol methylase